MRSVTIFGVILVVAMGFSWQRYTHGEEKVLTGTVLIDGKKDDLQKASYKGPDLDVEYERRTDGLGTYGWVTVTENKKKKIPDPSKPGSMMDSSETKVTKFKAGGGDDKLVDSLTPLMAVRSLDDVPADKIESFGLTAPDTSLTVTSGGKDRALQLGGETYGTKNRYVKEAASGHVYVVDDEVFKAFKFAATRLPERGLTDRKPEDIVSATLGQGADSVTWTHKNKDDKAAAEWDREGAPPPPAAPLADGTPAPAPTAKDVTFANWMDTALKLKSTAYVQDGDEPTTLEPAFDLTLRADGKPDETIHVLHNGDDWYARGEFTRGLVKLSRGPAEDANGDVDDILAGKTPPEKAKPVRPPTGATKPPGSDAAPPPGGPGGPHGPGGPPGMHPPGGGMPPGMPMPPGAAPGHGPATPPGARAPATKAPATKAPTK